MIPRFRKSKFEPKPIETDYWVDLAANEFGGVFKYYDWNAKKWKLTESITTEREPKFTASAAYNITNEDIINWDNKPELSDLDGKFDEFRKEIEDSITDITGGVTQSQLDEAIEGVSSLVSNVESKLYNKADRATTLAGYNITNAYTKQQVDKMLEGFDPDIEVPTKVSQLENDRGYITELDLSSKLPSDIVSDSNYVHTDNNFTTEHKNKLEGLDPEASKYDDTELRNKISANTEQINTTKNNLSDLTVKVQLNKEESLRLEQVKADKTAVYTREELDEIFKTFVRKVHNTYGFCDDRPNDLEVNDTGFVFFDYTTGYSLIWVTNEWRILQNNQIVDGLWNILLEEDKLEGRQAWWNFEYDDDYRFCTITGLTNDVIVDSTTDLLVPNQMLNKRHVLNLGAKTDYTVNIVKRNPTIAYTYQAVTDTFQRTYVVIDEDLAYNYIFLQPKEGEPKVYNNILNKEYIRSEYNDAGQFVLTFSKEDPTYLNHIEIGKGIRNIRNGAFFNVKSNVDEVLNLQGVNKIGIDGFRGSLFDHINFSDNPILLGFCAFRDCNIKTINFSKNLDVELNEYSLPATWFASTVADTLSSELYIQEGCKVIPDYAFNYRLITNQLELPHSLEKLGYSSFYGSRVFGEFNSYQLLMIGGWAFRQANFSSIILLDKVRKVGNSCFYIWSNDPCNVNSFTLSNSIEYIHNSAFDGTCKRIGKNLTIPSSCKVVGVSGFQYYGTNYGSDWGDASVKFDLILEEGLEYICYNAFSRSGFSNELILPNSLKYLGAYSFGHCGCFKNKTLNIPKNLQYISVCDNWLPNVARFVPEMAKEWLESHEKYLQHSKETGVYINIPNKYNPISKSGYSTIQPKEYIEDGGDIAWSGYQPFYGFAVKTLEAFTVDPENQWYAADEQGALYSKDWKRLIAVPPAKKNGGDTYIMHEGCVYMHDLAIGRHNFKSPVTVTRSDGTTVSVVRGTTTYPWINNGCYTKLLLADSFIIGTGELVSKYQKYAPQPENESNIQYKATYFSGISDILVKDTNPNYTSIDGVIYTKDVTELVFISYNKIGEINIPNTVTKIRNVYHAAFKSGVYTREQAAAWNGTFKPNTYQCPVGVHMHVPASVVEIDPFAIIQLSFLSRYGDSTGYCNSLTIDPGNPKYMIDPTTKNVVEK